MNFPSLLLSSMTGKVKLDAILKDGDSGRLMGDACSKESVGYLQCGYLGKSHDTSHQPI